MFNSNNKGFKKCNLQYVYHLTGVLVQNDVKKLVAAEGLHSSAPGCTVDDKVLDELTINGGMLTLDILYNIKQSGTAVENLHRKIQLLYLPRFGRVELRFAQTSRTHQQRSPKQYRNENKARADCGYYSKTVFNHFLPMTRVN